ncbi:hypothetical protein SARC_01666 [Sphaeroforma arctica JP610]|uniref:Uncharacterized protein n=1 Tax=Sphaeroforma arctica JP610 TaxID=667725 RepID=A0A0L0GBB1_9EUKA|nr:hypothetical protein SARC_01666 [Sphaeroforma arctica JP610]KNC86189.1 hypothetical protein SARC_01666 [Sphaeroforma arctica JP610]|eukprot:XP_014160091.1 hypothetical protein SARC_01666 [Sphaeroforma arctica JP610]
MQSPVVAPSAKPAHNASAHDLVLTAAVPASPNMPTFLSKFLQPAHFPVKSSDGVEALTK